MKPELTSRKAWFGVTLPPFAWGQGQVNGTSGRAIWSIAIRSIVMRPWSWLADPRFSFPVLPATQIVLAVLASIMIAAIGVALGEPYLMLAMAIAPIAAIFAWTQPFLICALFVAFSYFRLPEAYPALAALKLVLLLGGAATVLLASKALLSKSHAEPANNLRFVSCLALGAAIACAAPFSQMTGGPLVALALPVLMGLAIICTLSWGKLLHDTAMLPVAPNMRWFIAYFVALCASTMVSQGAELSAASWMGASWKIAAMTLAVAWMARTERDFSRAAWIFITSGVLIAVVAIYNSVLGIGLVEGSRVTIGRIEGAEHSGGAGGVLADPNDLSLILLFPLSLVCARLVYSQSRTQSLILLVALGLTTWAIIATQSRGAVLGLVAAVAVIVWSRFRSIKFAAVVVCIALPVLVTSMGISERQSGSFASYRDGSVDESASVRLEAWHTAVKMALARPLTGIGISNFSALYSNYTDFWGNRDRATHSMWFEVLAEIGIPGFVLFVTMIVSTLKVTHLTIVALAARKASPSLRATALGLRASLVATCVSGTFLSQAHTWPVFMIVGLSAALYSQSARSALDANSA